jgi:Ser/Thr protein kinase RdoA (MazF antagonist)
VARSGQDRLVDFEDVGRAFGLGELRDEPVAVTGGLSNQMWRVVAGDRVFAVKRMVVNAERPGFVEAVEASFAVEMRAWAAGIPMPEPIPCGGRALARIADGALVRVHRWVDGESAVGTAAEALGLLGRIHRAGRPRWGRPPVAAWRGLGWPADVRELARRVAQSPPRVLVVDSHGDLDRKNTLRRADGTLMALDWDAAGPVAAVHEAVGVALDWAGAEPGAFWAALGSAGAEPGAAGAALGGYGDIPREPWIFGGWLAAQGGWLDYQAGTATGAEEVVSGLRRVREIEALVALG